MKKSLIALAALAATASFAQSSVVLDGYFDRGYTVTDNSNNAKDLKAVSSSAGTTTFGIKVREDLGGGLSIGGQVNTDWADLGGNTQGSAVGTAQTGGFANSQSFVDVTGSFGVVRFGTPNNFTLTNATAVASPLFSTAIGSAYSSSFSIANGLGTGATGLGGTVGLSTSAGTAAAVTGARAIRIANTIQYSSPAFSGFSVHLGYTPKNDNVAAVTPGVATGNTVGVTEGALRYTNGPIDAMLSTIKYSVGSNGAVQNILTGATQTAAAVGFAANTLAANLTSTQNLLGVTYAVMPNFKLHGGYGTFSSSNDLSKGNSEQIGATYTVGAVDILAQYAKVNDKSVNNVDRKMTGLGVNYNLSKTARLYARYDNINYAASTAGFSGDKQTRYAFGVSKSF